MKKITIKSEKEMHALAAKVAFPLRGGEVLALHGNLGSGKTTFTKGLAKALGVKAVVQSPTFLLLKCYPTKLKSKDKEPVSLCHIDAYRVKKEQELITIGAGELFGDPHVITVIEWADLVPDLIPEGALRIDFEAGTKDNERVVTIRF